MKRLFLLSVFLGLVVALVSSVAAGQAPSSSLDQDLLSAVKMGNVATVQQLLQKGANINARDTYGDTALIWAIRWDGYDVEKLLLEKGANPETKNQHGETALMIAVSFNNASIVRLLLESGAKVEAKDNNGNTALLIAERRKLNAIAQLLRQGPAQGTQSELEAYLKDFQKSRGRPDDVLRAKIIQLVTSLPAPPAIPEEARQLFLQASSLIKQTSNPKELRKPIELLSQALVMAPWWGNAYYNLSRALELSGEYDKAIEQLNYYLQLKPAEADAGEARAHIAAIWAEGDTAARKRQENERAAALKYVTGGVSRIRISDGPSFWLNKNGGRGIGDLYTYWVPEEAPFYANVFRMPNGRILTITLNAQTTNGAYAGDLVAVSDWTDESCRQFWSHLKFGARDAFDVCGFHYEVDITNPPNATVMLRYGTTGASVTLPVALLYRGRALKGEFSGGQIYQGGSDVKVLQFDTSVVGAAYDSNVNAMGLTPTSVTPYQGKK